MRCPNIKVRVDLDVVRANVEAIRRRIDVRLIAVIKSDAYGLGAERVRDAIDAVVDEYGYFALYEAEQLQRPGVILGPPSGDATGHRALGVRPAVATVEDAERFRGTPVAISVDTGMQRFGCPNNRLDELSHRCDVYEFYSHAVTIDAAMQLKAACDGRGKPYHAAATDLLDYPEVWFDAVRPGLALYRGAVRVTARLHAVRDTSGRVGYSGFTSGRVGIILGGYSNHLPLAPVQINGRRQRVLEAGMNTAFVSADPSDKPGDEVVLLGDDLDEMVLANELGVRPHEILCRYTSMGQRSYTP